MKKFICFASSLLLLVLSYSVNAEVAVIVHSSNSNALSVSDISKIYLGKKKSYPSGDQVVAINLSEGTSVREQFNRDILGKSDQQLKAYWSKLVFTGKGVPPKEVSNDAEVISLISTNPSMIGYVDASSVTADVKVIHKF